MSSSPYVQVDPLSELQNNGRGGKFTEIGTSGIEAYSGLLRAAYHTELRWPECFALFDRIRRSDPEMAIVRVMFETLGRSVSLEWQLPDDANAAEKAAQEFGYEVFDDLEGGIERWRDALLAYAPFHGWSWWEVIPALRREGWRPPGKDIPWRSKYNDNRIGVRSLAWRDESSLDHWDMDENTGRLYGMVQHDIPNEPVTIPIERSIHITFGDTESPEGLSPLEAVWRLERIKYGLELVQGIGFEHSAGYLNVETEKSQLTGEDRSHIRAMARAVMSVQEGNYAAWPKNMKGELKDVNFSAASSILESIRYYGLLKLQVYSMAWVAMATTSGAGSFAALKEGTEMFVQVFNAMMEGFVQQFDDQFGTMLFDVLNPNAFPGMRQRPKVVATPVEKNIALSDISTFTKMFASLFPMGEEDIIAIRRWSQFLPETLPETDEPFMEQEEDEEDEPAEDGEEEEVEGDDEAEDMDEDDAGEDEADLAVRPLAVGDDEEPVDVTGEAVISPADVAASVRILRNYARKKDPRLAEWLDADVVEGEEE